MDKYGHLERFTIKGRLLCDLELLLVGAFSPLNGFLTQADYTTVVKDMRLADGSVWPMPIVYRINDSEVEHWKDLSQVLLVDETNLPLAVFNVEDVYKPDLQEECQCVFGTTDTNHPYVSEVLANEDVHYVGGRVETINLPFHFDFQGSRKTPAQVKQEIRDRGWEKVLAFQTRNPMHRSHQELTLRTREVMKSEFPDLADEKFGILLHPVVGVTQACDVNYHTRVRCYQELVKRYPGDCATISLLPLSMRMGGPREALWHALIRKNYGCTHFVVGRDHAGPSYKDKSGNSFYGPYDAHSLVERFADEIGIRVIMSKLIVYVPSTNNYLAIDEVPEGTDTLNISGTRLREMLEKREEIPEWFTYPEISKILQAETKPKSETGICIYAVGLSGSGKSVLVRALQERFTELNDRRQVSILDGDIVRQELSKGLGFSREDRSLNVRRIGYVASEVVKHGGICLCSNIAPYRQDRQANREKISQHGKYLEVFVDTPLDKCEDRDCKGLYQLAREGKIQQFTGISDPFEAPEGAEYHFNNSNMYQLSKAVDDIIDSLITDGFICC